MDRTGVICVLKRKKHKSRLPEWVSDRFWIKEDGTLVIIVPCSPEEKERFQNKKAELKQLCYEWNVGWHSINPNDMKLLIQSYIICNLALGMIEQQLAQLQKAKGGNGSSANDGNHRQHWIPECYMAPFSEDGNTRKISRDLIANFSRKDIQRLKDTGRIGKVITTKHPDFCEPKSLHGEMYEHYYELFLSKVEGDYSKIPQNLDYAETLWEFIVLSSFFFILRCRTKEMKDSLHPTWRYRKELLLETIPQIISEMEIVRLGVEDVLPEEGRHKTFPFTQHPVLTVREKRKVSLWGIYTPECIIWFRNKRSKYKVRNLWKFSQEILFSLIGDETTRDLYFKPSDIPWSMHVAPPVTE